MTDAEDRYLREVSRDCERVLGAGCRLVDVERSSVDDSVMLVATYRLGQRTWHTAGLGSTVVDAHADLKAHLVIDRLRAGFTAYVEEDTATSS